MEKEEDESVELRHKFPIWRKKKEATQCVTSL